MDVVIVFELLVAVPIADALAHRVGAVEKLHEADAAFEQPAGQQAVAREAGLIRVRVVGAVKRVHRFRFAGQIADLGGLQLQPGRQFVRGDAGRQIRVGRVACADARR